jgi:hypothetical protein
VSSCGGDKLMSSGNNKEIEDWSRYDEEDGHNNYGYNKKKVQCS